MSDIVLDTNVLADFIASYYKFEINVSGSFEEYKTISRFFAEKLNLINSNYKNYGVLQDGVIIASTFAFVEIARQFEKIANKRFSIIQFRAFIESPPDWFIIYSLNEELFAYLNLLPSYVVMPGGNSLTLEWADTIHVATALSRDEICLLATTDGRLVNIVDIQKRLYL